MRTLKTLLVCSSAAAILACGVATAGEDNEAQAKARQASREKVKEMENQPGAPAGAVSSAPSATQVPAAHQQTTAEKPVQHLVVPKAADQDAIAKAREAARQTVAELEKSGAPATASAPEAPKKSKKTEATSETKQRASSPEKPASSGKAVAKSPKASTPDAAATISAPAASNAPTAPAQATAPKEAPAQQKPKATAKTSPSQLPEIERTASPFDQDRQQRLAELLKRYRADELSPEQYHAERAKILKGE